MYAHMQGLNEVFSFKTSSRMWLRKKVSVCFICCSSRKQTRSASCSVICRVYLDDIRSGCFFVSASCACNDSCLSM